MEQYIESKKGKKEIVYSCTFLGIAFTILFYEHILGINYGIFVSLLMVAFLCFTKRCNIHINMSTKIAMIPTFILPFGFAIHGNFFLNSVNFLLSPLLLLWVTTSPIFPKRAWDYFLSQGLQTLGKMHLYVKAIEKLFFKKQLKAREKGIIIGLFISLGLLLFLIPLMSSADKVFGYLLVKVIKGIVNIKVIKYVLQFILAFLVASYLFGYVNNLNFLAKKNQAQEIKLENEKEGIAVDKGMIPFAGCTILAIINGVYLLFSMVQFQYLFLGNPTEIPDFSYAQYARSGFFQMLVLTMINFVIVIIFKWLLLESPLGIQRFAKSMMTILVFFNGVFIASSFYRMHLYESTYGYTLLRLGVYLVLILESIIMLLLLVSIWNRKIPIIQWSLFIGIVFYMGVNLLNMDAFIAKKNVDRYYQIGVIDVDYFYSLSYDAIPQMERLLDCDNFVIRQRVLERFHNFEYNEESSWQEFSFGKEKARKIIEKYPVENP